MGAIDGVFRHAVFDAVNRFERAQLNLAPAQRAIVSMTVLSRERVRMATTHFLTQ